MFSYQGGMKAFSDALTEAVLATKQLPDTPSVRLRLRFVFAGIGTLLRYHGADEADELKRVLATSIRSQFPEVGAA
ncbi:hypothetical protein ACFQHW_10095 [Lapidilactobacillus achengensis]|uniref:TetR family transcriptional regulator n=1 Tax=Lapidilactobacillus achengensis TaxID=2486000 RepID=A0ABW1UPQ6_9LACO|nr:hypothetical protein [Lapidilactobacillus achengensis]